MKEKLTGLLSLKIALETISENCIKLPDCLMVSETTTEHSAELLRILGNNCSTLNSSVMENEQEIDVEVEERRSL